MAIRLDNFARDIPSTAGFDYRYEVNGEIYFDIV
jgi:hypothetical protein